MKIVHAGFLFLVGAIYHPTEGPWLEDGHAGLGAVLVTHTQVYGWCESTVPYRYVSVRSIQYPSRGEHWYVVTTPCGELYIRTE